MLHLLKINFIHKVTIVRCRVFKLILFLCSLQTAHSQARFISDTTKQVSTQGRFLTRSIGPAFTIYRDFATSPLFYRGGGITLGSGRLNTNEKRWRFFEMSLSANLSMAKAPKSSYFQTRTSGFFFHISACYHYLHHLQKYSFNKTRIHIGGAALFMQNVRINSKLQNAAAGLENFFHVMFVAKLNRDISRTGVRTVKYFFISKHLKPVKRSLSFQTNIGVLNFNRRPGYAYVYDNELDGSGTKELLWILGSYRWSMNGWRLGTRLEFSRFRPNGNGRKWAYIWDAAHAPGKFEPFQMASHHIQHTILINNNKH